MKTRFNVGDTVYTVVERSDRHSFSIAEYTIHKVEANGHYRSGETDLRDWNLGATPAEAKINMMHRVMGAN